MLIDYRRRLSDSEKIHLDACLVAVAAIEHQVEQLLADHRKNSRRWYPHEIVPWGLGKDFNEIPWDAAQSPVRPDIVVALETNLLTEDNLPYYHSRIETMVEANSVWSEWNRLWTSEEAAHAQTIRDYLHLMRVMDPKVMEDNRRIIMQSGFDRTFSDPMELFAYTATQELATRISHLRAGQKADEPIALRIFSTIARDENFHFIFYRGVVKALLDIVPELMLPAIMNQFYSFSMPGTGMSNYELRQAIIADAGIYGTREHRDMVILPLIKYWDIAGIKNLSSGLQKIQSRILRIEQVLDRMVERQDRAQRKTD